MQSFSASSGLEGGPWRAAQALGILVTVVLIIGLVVWPDVALPALWNIVIPLLPATFLLTPTLWRSVCPLATLNMLSNGVVSRKKLSARALPAVGMVGIVLLGLLVPARRFLFNEEGTALAGFIAAVGGTAFLLGAVFDAKAGFCNAICPVLPVEKLYGQHPLFALRNPRCAQCTLCTPKSCVDLVPEKAGLQAMGAAHRSHAWLGTAFGVFAAAFPGFILGYFTTANGPVTTAPGVYGHVVLWAGGSYLTTLAVVWLFKVRSEHVLPVLAGLAAGLYYWFVAPPTASTLGLPDAGTWGLRAVALTPVGLLACVAAGLAPSRFPGVATAGRTCRVPTQRCSRLTTNLYLTLMRSRLLVFLASVVVVAGLVSAGCASEDSDDVSTTLPAAPTLTAQSSGSNALFIGISPIDERVVWISGTGGTYARTTDGGATWQAGTVPGADSLQFRDVHAVDAETAYLLSIGNGPQSRIYKTTDGGRTWTLQFTNPQQEGFFDCMDFWDAEHGIAFSDSFGGVFYLITTSDGGATWTRVPPDRLPPADPGEGSFAASGTCLVAQGDSTAWVGTAAGLAARVLKTTDRGQSWSVVHTPIVGGSSTAGIASLAFRDADHGAAFGGQIDKPEEHADNVAVTRDGGQTWTLAGRPQFSGAVYGAAYVPGTSALVAVGPKGVDYSADEGMTWTSLDTLTHWSVGFGSSSTGWAIGPEGRITRIAFDR